MRKLPFSRRKFLQTTTCAFGPLNLFPRRLLGGPGFTPPSEELTKAVIGVGAMGQNHLEMGESRLLAICDVDEKHLTETLAKCQPEVKAYHDYREVLERSDIDIVHIATPPHWHALIAIAAAQAGKDVWCEKPTTRTIGEGVDLGKAVKEHNRIFRVNTRHRLEEKFFDHEGFFRSGMKASQIKKLVDSGMLGWPLTFTISEAGGFPWKLEKWKGDPNLEPKPVPPHLDYDFWLGPAPDKPYNPNRVHQKFRGYWDYDGGGLGDMGQHFLDPVQYFLGKDDESPIEISVDAPPQHHDAVGVFRRIEMTYDDGCRIVLDGETREGKIPIIEGPEGTVYKDFESAIPDLKRDIEDLPEPEPLETDFCKCVRERKKFPINEDVAFRACTLVNLAKIAMRVGRNLKFDPIKLRFDNDDANRLIRQPMRLEWI